MTLSGSRNQRRFLLPEFFFEKAGLLFCEGGIKGVKGNINH